LSVIIEFELPAEVRGLCDGEDGGSSNKEPKDKGEKFCPDADLLVWLVTGLLEILIKIPPRTLTSYIGIGSF
jgi:hypothetical protein